MAPKSQKRIRLNGSWNFDDLVRFANGILILYKHFGSKRKVIRKMKHAHAKKLTFIQFMSSTDCDF